MDNSHVIKNITGLNVVLDDDNVSFLNPNGALKQKFNASENNHFLQISGSGPTRPDLYQKCNRNSHSSDTSSAYSGSDTMTSIHSSSIDAEEVDLSGLVESVVDSDEEDLVESMEVSLIYFINEISF
jgi:hypothetical protein